jgi:hypothetical protein
MLVDAATRCGPSFPSLACGRSVGRFSGCAAKRPLPPCLSSGVSSQTSPPESPHVAMPAHHISSYISIMSETTTGDHREAGRYEIRLKGRLDPRWAAWFDGLSLTHESDGTTLISGLVADQAALHGLLQRVRDIGLPLISVTRIEPDQPDIPIAPPTSAQQFTQGERR